MVVLVDRIRGVPSLGGFASGMATLVDKIRLNGELFVLLHIDTSLAGVY